MRKQTIPTGPFAANCTVLWKDGSGECWVIDPGEDAADIAAFMDGHSLKPALIALTHGHFDHINGVPGLLAQVRVETLYLPAGSGDGDDQLAAPGVETAGAVTVDPALQALRSCVDLFFHLSFLPFHFAP